MSDDLLLLLDRIRGLLDRRASDSVLLAELEHTLTDGYAERLRLDGERRRLAGRIGQLAHSVESAEQACELRRLAAELAATEGDLAELGSLLAALRDRAANARAA